MLDNYLSIDGVGQVLLDESVELQGCHLPQSRVDDGKMHPNLLLAYAAACRYKCPVRGCHHEIAPRSGNVREQHLQRDGDGHLLSRNDEPQSREDLIFIHWEKSHCPASTIAWVKAACSYFNAMGKGCPTTLTPKVYDLKRHLKNVHSVANVSHYDLCSLVKEKKQKQQKQHCLMFLSLMRDVVHWVKSVLLNGK